MVQSIDDVSDVFAHITVYIIRFLKKFRCLVYKVGGQEVVEETFLISLVELVHTVGEKTKSSTDEDAAGFSLFQLGGNLDHAVSRGDHIVDDDHILALYVSTQELMSNDGVLAVYDAGVIAAFVEHTHIHAEYVGHVDGTAHAALIRADDHHGVFVNVKIRNSLEKTLDELVNRLYGLKAF